MSRIIPCQKCGQLNRLSGKNPKHEARCASCKTVLFDGLPIVLKRSNFDQQIRSEDLPVLVDFWAAWCGPCRAMAPVFEKTAAEYADRLRFGKIDTEAEPELAARFAIRSIPTLILFKGGKEVDRVSGALAAGDLKRWIDQHSI